MQNLRHKITSAVPKRGIIYLLALLTAGCANIVSPTGGPRDTTPPEVILETPPSGGVDFTENSFTLRFSEFIQTGNLQQQLLVSPPLANPVEIRLRGRNLTIRFHDTLISNATYAFFFGDAIKDITEGNPLPPYTYYFSTGPQIDQHTIKGRVFNAWDQEVEENILVMLYKLPMSDSAVALEKPRYVTRPDQNGHFEFQHIADTLYHLFALADLNNNMRYDLLTEGVAFHSEPVRPWRMPSPPPDDPDTLSNAGLSDTLSAVITTDESTLDTLTENGTDTVTTHSEPFVLRMFVGEDSVQRVVTSRSDGRNKAYVAFRYPVQQPDIFSPEPGLDSIMLWQLTPGRDTLWVWLQQHTFEALPLAIVDTPYFADTLRTALRQPTGTGRTRLREPTTTLSMNVPRGGSLRPARDPIITFSSPLSHIDLTSSTLSTSEDTIPLQLQVIDSLVPIRFAITNTLEQGTEYTLMIPAGMITGWDGTNNDTIRYHFTPARSEDFGTLTLISGLEGEQATSVIVLLTDERMNEITRGNLSEDGAITFPYLPAGQYYLKAILDSNGNGRWDTGDYWKRIQPEKVKVIPSAVSLRANWEEEVVWEISF